MLADKIGVTFQQVQKYEEGANGARGSRLVQIAKALDIPIGALFEGVGIAGRTDTCDRTVEPRHQSVCVADAPGSFKDRAARISKSAGKVGRGDGERTGSSVLSRYFLNGPRRPNLPLTEVEICKLFVQHDPRNEIFPMPKILSRAFDPLAVRDIPAYAEPFIRIIGLSAINWGKIEQHLEVLLHAVNRHDFSTGKVKFPTTSFRLKCLLFLNNGTANTLISKLLTKQPMPFVSDLRRQIRAAFFLLIPAFRVFLKALLPKFTY